MLDYIPDDGYTEPFFIRGVPGLHGPIGGKYRPLTNEQRAIILEANAKASPSQRMRTLAACIAKQVTEWDRLDRDGKPIPVTAAAVSAMKPAPHDRLWNIVAGWEASDMPEDATAEQRGSLAELELQALLEGKPVGAAREEADAKN